MRLTSVTAPLAGTNPLAVVGAHIRMGEVAPIGAVDDAWDQVPEAARAALVNHGGRLSALGAATRFRWVVPPIGIVTTREPPARSRCPRHGSRSSSTAWPDLGRRDRGEHRRSTPYQSPPGMPTAP